MIRRLLPLLITGAVLAGEADPPRVLVLLAQGFNKGEFFQSVLPLRAAGYAVDIAAAQAGPVIISNDGTPDKAGLDPVADLTLDQIGDGARWCALVIPGGYSPGRLEKLPAAVEACRVFAQAGKPIAAVCHGPRLLLAAGLLDGRVFTCLHNVPDEVADAWKACRGTWVDQAVVVDGGLITSRFPGDMTALTRRLLEELSIRGGLPWEIKPARVLLVAPDLPAGHARWAVKDAAGILGVTVDLVASAEDVAKAEKIRADAGDGNPPWVCIATLAGPQAEALAAAQAFKATLIAAQVAEVAIPAGTTGETLAAAVVREARTCALPIAPVPPPPFAAALAVCDGFDDQAVAAAHFHAASKGLLTVVVAPRQGWIHGQAGTVIEATATYADNLTLTPDALVVAPGGLWPMQDDAARQAQQPAWIEEQGRRDRERLDWLLARHAGGAHLVVVGLDALRLARTGKFPGAAFAAPNSTVWSFGKTAKRSADPVAATAERITTVRNADALAQAWSAP
jgi:protease I